MHRLKEAQQKVTGFKQSLKAVENGSAVLLYIAQDSAPNIQLPLLEMCTARHIPVVKVKTMVELGRVCEIQVGASVAAILASEDGNEGI